MVSEKVCEKCGYANDENKSKKGLTLCNICLFFSPDDPEELDEYVSHKINGAELESFRKNASEILKRQKRGMIKKAKEGKIMSRAPYGYKIENNRLVPDENAREVEKIFEDFLNSPLSLNKLSKKYGFSVNGLKKILFNFTYLGKIKFNGEIHDGTHVALISSTLFNHVQNKLENLKIKNPNTK